MQTSPPLQTLLTQTHYIVFTRYPDLGLSASDPMEIFDDAATDWADRKARGLDSAVCEVSLLSAMIDVTDAARKTVADWIEARGQALPEWCGGESAYTWESVNVYGRDDAAQVAA